MSINNRIGRNRYLPSVAQKAKNILGDKSKVRELIGSASSKLESASGRLTSVKRDLGTLIELLKA